MRGDENALQPTIRPAFGIELCDKGIARMERIPVGYIHHYPGFDQYPTAEASSAAS